MIQRQQSVCKVQAYKKARSSYKTLQHTKLPDSINNSKLHHQI